MKLDRSKPYGVVWGVDEAHFEQAGRLFDADGDEVIAEQPGETAEKKKPGRKPKASGDDAETAPTSEKAETTPIDAQIAAQGV